MLKNKTLERLLRLLITLVGAGLGAVAAALVLPVLSRQFSTVFTWPYGLIGTYFVLCFLGALLLFLLSKVIIQRVLQLSAAIERRWSSMQQTRHRPKIRLVAVAKRTGIPAQHAFHRKRVADVKGFRVVLLQKRKGFLSGQMGMHTPSLPNLAYSGKS